MKRVAYFAILMVLISGTRTAPALASDAPPAVEPSPASDPSGFDNQLDHLMGLDQDIPFLNSPEDFDPFESGGFGNNQNPTLPPLDPTIDTESAPLPPPAPVKTSLT